MAKPQRVGVYPGTFDPITNGHMDIIARAGRVVDRLVIGVAINAGKGPLFTLDERVAMLREEIGHLAEPGIAERITIEPFEGLLVDFTASVGGNIIVRGLRAVVDFEYEFQMSSLNAHLNPGIETIFLMASAHHQFISSSYVREISKLGGDVGAFVSPRIKEHLRQRHARQ